MRKNVAATVCLGMVLSFGAPAGAQEGISVFEGGEDEGGPITIGGESAEGGEAAEGGGGLVIEGVRAGGGGGTYGARATLPFVEMGGVMFVPAKVAGKKVFFIFDTGAGLTTLTPEFARKIGAAPGKDAPAITTMTANGPAPTRLSVARSITLANVGLGAFTFSTCTPCGGGTLEGAPIVGLLGRNVISRVDFRVDDEARAITLRAKPGAKNLRRDIERWIAVDFQQGKSKDEGVMLLTNRAPRRIRDVTFEIVCQTAAEGSFTQEVTFSSVAARKTGKRSFRMLKPGGSNDGARRCVVPSLDLKSARW